MPPLTPLNSPTVEAIYESYKKSAEKRWQRRLGASQLGHACDRYLWQSFRWWAEPEEFDGRMLRLFDYGHKAEPRFADDLEGIGAEVHLVNTETGEQFELIGCNGHLVCKMDGAIINLPEAPKTWHVLEAKTHNDKSFKDLQAKGVKASKPQHYIQCLIGMALSGMKRCLYIAENKNTSELYTERLRWEECKDDAEAALARAQKIINSIEIPKRISENPESKHCKYCRFKEQCHNSVEPPATCRSCSFVTPIHDGNWFCNKYLAAVDHDTQLRAKECPSYDRTIGITPREKALALHEIKLAEEVDSNAVVVLHTPDGKPYKAVAASEYAEACKEPDWWDVREKLPPDGEWVDVRGQDGGITKAELVSGFWLNEEGTYIPFTPHYWRKCA